MKSFGIWTVIVMANALSASAWSADVVERDQQRDVNQQQRIEQGLKSGELSTKEAGQLEREQNRVDKIEARDLKDGSISAAEQARLKAPKTRRARTSISRSTMPSSAIRTPSPPSACRPTCSGM